MNTQDFFWLSGPDNKSSMLKDDNFGIYDKYNPCVLCHQYQIIDYFESDFLLVNKKYDLSFTYDNIPIVSEKFKQVCETNNFSGIDFKSFENLNGFYRLSISNIIRLDIEKMKIKFIDTCPVCQSYKEVINPLPLIIKQAANYKGNTLYISDIAFGSFTHKQPIIIVNSETKSLLKLNSLKGLVFYN